MELSRQLWVWVDVVVLFWTAGQAAVETATTLSSWADEATEAVLIEWGAELVFD